MGAPVGKSVGALVVGTMVGRGVGCNVGGRVGGGGPMGLLENALRVPILLRQYSNTIE